VIHGVVQAINVSFVQLKEKLDCDLAEKLNKKTMEKNTSKPFLMLVNVALKQRNEVTKKC